MDSEQPIGTLSLSARWLALGVCAAVFAALIGAVLFWPARAQIGSFEREVRVVDPAQMVDALTAERERRRAVEREVAELESKRTQADTAAREAAKAQQDATDALARASEDKQRAVEDDLVARLRSGSGPKTRGLSLSNESTSKSGEEQALEAARAAEAARAGELASARDAAARAQADQQRLAREVEAALKKDASSTPAGADPIEAALAKAAQPLQVAIQIPGTLDVGRTYTARVVVARGAGPGAAASVERFVAETRAPVARQIATESTDELSAVASGTRLKATALSDLWQTLRRDKAYKWEWTIEPTEAGQGALLIELRQKLLVDGRERIVNVDQFPVSVAINVTAWSRIVEAAGAAGPPLKDAEDIIKGLAAIFGAISATWLMRHKVLAMAGRWFGRQAAPHA